MGMLTSILNCVPSRWEVSRIESNRESCGCGSYFASCLHKAILLKKYISRAKQSQVKQLLLSRNVHEFG